MNNYVFDTILDPKTQQLYQDQGFIILKNFLSPFTIDMVKESAYKIFVNQMQAPSGEETKDMVALFQDDQAAFINCGKHAQHTYRLHELGLDPRIILTLQKVMGFTAVNICTRPVIFFNHPNLATKDIYHSVPPHQDWASMQGSMDSVVVWFPLVDVSKEMGALQVVPGSHKEGLIATEVIESFGVTHKYKEEDFIDVPLNRGDALFFSSFLVHKSGHHQSDKIRWSCHFRYNNMDDPDFINRKYPHPYIYKVKDYKLS